MKIAIVVCEKIRGICSTMGCFKAYNNRQKHFEQYGKGDLELNSFFMCDYCSSNSNQNLEKIAQSLKKAGIENVHLGICICKCEANRTQEIKEIFENAGLHVIEGTH